MVSFPSLGTALVGLLALASVVFPVSTATRSPSVGDRQGNGESGWSITSSPDRGTFDELDGVVVESSSQAWAVGRYIDSAGLSRAFIERSDDGAWRVAFTCRSSHNGYFTGISGNSPSDIWAVGYTDSRNYEDRRTLIEHWDGDSWNAYQSTVSGSLSGVSVLSSDDAWAVGVSAPEHGNADTLVEHWNGTTWQVVKSSGSGAANSLSSVVAISPADAWAVGVSDPSEYATQSLIEHWNGAEWSVVTVAELGIDSELRSVSGSSSDDVWATGYYEGQTSGGTATVALTEHWNGRAWKVLAVPGGTGDDLLAGSDTLSPSDAWAVGSQEGKDDLIIHWNGTAWSRIPGPAEPHALNLLFSISGNNSTGLTATGQFIDLRDFSYHTLVEQRP
jgi:hypothetical protein